MPEAPDDLPNPFADAPLPGGPTAGDRSGDPFGDLADPAVARDADNLARIFVWLADHEFPDYSPLYEHLARAIAHERWVPAFISRHTRSPFAGVLFLDCVRELTLVEPDLALARHYEAVLDGADPLDPDPWPLLRDLVRSHADRLGELLRTRAIQTNEVGRSAALLPAFTVVAERVGKPLALIEIGASAGLNLFFDRYHVDYGAAGSTGPPDATVRLHCEVRGPLRPPIPTRAPAVASRLGIDLHPVDVTDADAVRWLEACIWPDVPHRVERFRAAVALARAEPPELWTGNALDLVAQAIDAVGPDAVPCLDATWVLAYLDDDERSQLHDTLERAGADRTVAFVTAEYQGNTPWVPDPPEPPVSGHVSPTLLGLGLWDRGRTDHTALAWVQPHARWIEWLNSASAG